MQEQTMNKIEIFTKFTDAIVELYATRRSLYGLEVEQGVSYEAEIKSINARVMGIMDAADVLDFEGEHFLSFYQRNRKERRKVLGYTSGE